MLQKLRTVNQLAKENPALTTGGIRWDIFNGGSNGLATSGAIIRKGRRIYIDPDLYLDWLRGISHE
jgi:hypothetical protein